MQVHRIHIILVLLVLLSLSVLAIEKPMLNCPKNPIDKDYKFKWQADGYKKVRLEIGYDKNFAKKTYTKIKTKQNPTPINKKKTYKKILNYVIRSSGGKIYARIFAKSKKTKKYSNVCEFTLDSFEFLDGSDWETGEYKISSEKAYKSKKSLKVPFFEDQSSEKFIGPDLTELFGSANPFDLEGAKITVKVNTPKKCSGKKYGKNWMQIHLIAPNGATTVSPTVLFRGSKWKTIKADLSGHTSKVGKIYVKIGTKGKCNGNFYIDNLIIEKDSQTAIYNFE